MLESSVQIIYATTTGNSEILAEETALKLDALGLKNNLCNAQDFDIERLYKVEKLLAFVSTDSGGLPPIMAEDLFQSLRDKMKADLGHLSYAVLALGDSYYTDFCRAGKDFDQILEKLGARRIIERVDCDIDYWDDYERWFNKVRAELLEKEKLLNH